MGIEVQVTIMAKPILKKSNLFPLSIQDSP